MDTYNGPAAGTDPRIPSQSFSVTPSDTATFAQEAAALWIGVTGNVTVKKRNGSTQLFTNVPVGFFIFACIGVMATGTTATGIVAVN